MYRPRRHESVQYRRKAVWSIEQNICYNKIAALSFKAKLLAPATRRNQRRFWWMQGTADVAEPTSYFII